MSEKVKANPLKIVGGLTVTLPIPLVLGTGFAWISLGVASYLYTPSVKSVEKEMREHIDSHHLTAIDTYNKQLHKAFNDFKATRKAKPTHKEVLTILAEQFYHFVADLPKNQKEWTKQDKTVYDYGFGLLKVYAEKTHQMLPAPKRITSHQSSVVTAYGRNYQNIK